CFPLILCWHVLTTVFWDRHSRMFLKTPVNLSLRAFLKRKKAVFLLLPFLLKQLLTPLRFQAPFQEQDQRLGKSLFLLRSKAILPGLMWLTTGWGFLLKTASVCLNLTSQHAKREQALGLRSSKRSWKNMVAALSFSHLLSLFAKN